MVCWWDSRPAIVWMVMGQGPRVLEACDAVFGTNAAWGGVHASSRTGPGRSSWACGVVVSPSGRRSGRRSP